MNWGLVLAAGAAAIGALAAAVFKPLLAPALHEARAWPRDDRVGKIPVLPIDELRDFYEDKRVLIVGGTRGAGFGIAKAVAGAGGAVTLVGRSESTGRKALRVLNGEEEDGEGSPGGGRPRHEATFLRGDIGTVAAAKETVARIVELASQESRDGGGPGSGFFDCLVVTAAVFPDWSGRKPHQQEDGIDAPFAVAVVGRYALYKSMGKFLKPGGRVLNVMASGEAMDRIDIDRDLASGRRGPRNLLHSIMNFGCGNELVMMLIDSDPALKGYTLVSTHPGALQTDLFVDQGRLFGAVSSLYIALLGVTVEECGLRQASVLASDRVRGGSLRYVSSDLRGRVPTDAFAASAREHLPWLRDFLQELKV
jgi:hypothetical protein